MENYPDMYLPLRLLLLGIFLLIVGIVCTVVCFVHFALGAAICAGICLILGICALLCWSKQKIYIISDSEFTYTTMFGNTRTYRFSDIEGIRKNADSYTLFVGKDKVHIEAMALISERLMEHFVKAAKENRKS